MDIRYNNETAATVPLEFAQECVQLAGFVLEQESAPENCAVSLTLVDAQEMAALNAEYRGKDGPTDVLSFPCDEAGETSDAETPLLLGDVIIAPEVAAANNVALLDELRLLTVHGLLHLLGYDHEVEDEATAMEQRQDALLAKWASS